MVGVSETRPRRDTDFPRLRKLWKFRNESTIKESLDGTGMTNSNVGEDGGEVRDE